jgi:superfamily II DNA or RNA helicase
MDSKKSDSNLVVHISRDGTYIKELSPELTRKIKNYFTLRNKTIMGYFKETLIYKDIKNKLFIPRFGSFILKNKFKNLEFKNSITPDNKLNHINYIGKFNGNQEIIFNEIINTTFSDKSVKKGNSGLILNLQAGQGKSFLGMSLIGYLKCRTLIVVHNSSILQQWEKILKEYIPDAKLGLYYGKKKIFGDIVIGVINSLIMPDIKLPDINSPKDFFDRFDFVIYDECHEYTSSSRNKIFNICNCPYSLGLSATPNDREDNLDKIIHWNIGSILIASNLKDYTLKDIPFKGKVIKVKYLGPDKYTEQLINEKLEMTSVPLMMGQLAEDPYRLKMVIDLTLKQHSKGFNTFVFADRRDYLEQIRLGLEEKALSSQMLTNNNEMNEIEKLDMQKLDMQKLDMQKLDMQKLTIKNSTNLEAVRLVGGSTSEQMDNAKETKNIILTTYQYMGTGCSIPKMNCLILATPRKSKSRQIINRIFRLGSDYTIEREIIDIVDWKTTLKNQWNRRKLYYDEQEFTIEEIKVNYTDYN